MKKKKLSIISIMLSALLLTGLACKSGDGLDNGKEQEDPPVMSEIVKPFWGGNIMTDESIMLIAPTDSNGYLTGAPRAKLLFAADEIVSVKQYFHMNNTGSVTFAEGTDFEYKDGMICALGGYTTDLEGNRSGFNTSMPYVTDKQVSGEKPFPNLGSSTQIPSTDDGLYLPFTEGYHIVQLQLSVTYKHSDTWSGTIPAYYGADVLTKTYTKLSAKAGVEMFVFGDSISTGANSSSILGIAPNLKTFPELVADELSSYYKADVKLTNKSVGGWTTVNAISDSATTGWVGGQQVSRKGIAKTLAEDLPGYKPDIAVIGFGMNDATLGVGMNNYYTNMKKIITEIRGRNQDCEFILLGTMLANPKAKNQSKNQSEYFTVLTRLAGEFDGIAAIDVGAVHKDLLDAGKNYIEMTGNNVNHPNDFMARVYAMNILSALIDCGKAGGQNASGTGDPDSLINAGYINLFSDERYQSGFRVSSIVDGAQDPYQEQTIKLVDNTDNPLWVFAQWGSKYDIMDPYSSAITEQGKALRYRSKGKTINGSYLWAKEFSFNTETGAIYMELNAEAEYDTPRIANQPWPHTLVEQSFSGDNLIRLADCEDIRMQMTAEISKFEDKMSGASNPDMHAAQFVWYVTLQNRTPGNPDYGKYIWFGLTLWDNRNAGQVKPLYAAQDGGKEANTGAFIYSPASTAYYKDGIMPPHAAGINIDFPLIGTARTAYDLAIQRGYLGGTKFEDLYIGSMNYGFEVPGTYNVGARVDKFGILYK